LGAYEKLHQFVAFASPPADGGAAKFAAKLPSVLARNPSEVVENLETLAGALAERGGFEPSV
jgi:hypothetical protein